MPKGNTEGTRIDRDAVETTREVLVDWSNLKEIYDELGTIVKVAQAFGCSTHKVQNEMQRRGVEPKQRGRAKGFKQSPEWHAAHKRAMARPDVKKKYRDNLLKRLPTMCGPSANSPLEKLLHNALAQKGISFRTQTRKLDKYIVDIEIDQQPIIIEADGALHKLRVEQDRQRDLELSNVGYLVFRFSGREINQSPAACIQRVIDACGLISDPNPSIIISDGMCGENNPSWRGGKSIMICAGCGKEFSQYKSNRKSKRAFCCANCYYDWLRNHPEDLPSRWKTRT